MGYLSHATEVFVSVSFLLRTVSVYLIFTQIVKYSEKILVVSDYL